MIKTQNMQQIWDWRQRIISLNIVISLANTNGNCTVDIVEPNLYTT